MQMIGGTFPIPLDGKLYELVGALMFTSAHVGSKIKRMTQHYCYWKQSDTNHGARHSHRSTMISFY